MINSVFVWVPQMHTVCRFKFSLVFTFLFVVVAVYFVVDDVLNLLT